MRKKRSLLPGGENVAVQRRVRRLCSRVRESVRMRNVWQVLASDEAPIAVDEPTLLSLPKAPGQTLSQTLKPSEIRTAFQ